MQFDFIVDFIEIQLSHMTPGQTSIKWKYQYNDGLTFWKMIINATTSCSTDNCFYIKPKPFCETKINSKNWYKCTKKIIQTFLTSVFLKQYFE